MHVMDMRLIGNRVIVDEDVVTPQYTLHIILVVYEQGNLVERIKRNRVKIRRTKPNED